MKIVRIFADSLFTFHFEGNSDDEFSRLMDLWTDPQYLYQFIKENAADCPQNMKPAKLVRQIWDNANQIDDALCDICQNDSRLEVFFQPLHNAQYQQEFTLSKQKGRKNYLRLYAIKIDENLFVITGGAIKFHHLMRDRPHTQSELDKLNRCCDYLKEQGVFDSGSFFEFINQ